MKQTKMKLTTTYTNSRRCMPWRRFAFSECV